MQSISPVFTEAEVSFEQKVPEHQEEYFTIVGLPVTLGLVDRETRKTSIVNPWGMSFRFQLSEEERAAVAAGKDLILTQLNFGNPVTPMNVQFCAKNEKPIFGEVPPESISLPSAADLDAVAEEMQAAEATIANNVIEMPSLPDGTGDSSASPN